MTVVVNPQPQRQILMFVAYNDVWWPEFKVMYEALSAAGYSVDVRSSGVGYATSNYSAPADQTPSAAGLDPNFPSPVTYSEFTAIYQANFGQTWNAAWNPMANITLNGRIQDVANLNSYDALVIPGGRGMVAYRYDGSYADLASVTNSTSHIAPAAEVQAAAIRLNELIGQALAAGKPVVAECHGAPTVAFARVPSSTGGYLNLGRSVLEGRYATGYAFNDSDTPQRYQDLGVQLLAREKVVIDGPEAPDFSGNARDLIVTSADWYPETVAHVARTLLNMLESYPTPTQRTRALNVLVYGGDEPTNYAPQAPARYTDFVSLLNDATDEFAITATGLNDPNQLTVANLQNYDVLFYFGHNMIPGAAQNAIRTYVDDGGGLVAIHHAIYNQGDANGVLVDLIGGELPSWTALNSENGLMYFGQENHLINVNLGHFVSTYGVHLLPNQTAQSVHYSSPRSPPNPNADNDPQRGYWSFRISANDELYLNTAFRSGVSFGRGVNALNRLFSNDRFSASSSNPNNGAYDTSGWVRRYDNNLDGTEGRIVYLQPGETQTRTLSHPSYRQAVKNAVIWAAN